jgi:hypothetical protein
VRRDERETAMICFSILLFFRLGRLIQEIQESEDGWFVLRFKLLFHMCRGVISVHTKTGLLQFYIQVFADFQSEVW